VSAKKHSTRISILNEEFTIRSDTPPEHTQAVAKYLDQAIRKIMSSGAVVESNRAVILGALQVTAELFEARAGAEATTESIRELSEYVRPLLPPSKRQPVSP
jgi:cell division protein ZapA (FtsZ GTPase activity inhibitor)